MRAALACLLLLACHKQPGAGDDDDGVTDAKVDAPADSSEEGWQTLISRSWNLAAPTTDPVEAYRCIRIQVPTDMWIAGFHSIAPTGTHHSVLTISDSSTQTGEYDCTAGSLDNRMLYAAGVMTDDNYFPTGVAIHLAAGTYINLNLHLFNTNDIPLTGTSGVAVKLVKAADVVHEADMMFSGTYNIAIPPDNAPHTASGTCTIASDIHIFTLWPHMHQIATHQSLVVTHGATPTTMLDVPYQFTDQKNYPMQDTLVHANDKIDTTCTFVNNTGVTDPPAHTVYFGDSSTSEMCFTGIYKYPAGGSLFQCVH